MVRSISAKLAIVAVALLLLSSRRTTEYWYCIECGYAAQRQYSTLHVPVAKLDLLPMHQREMRSDDGLLPSILDPLGSCSHRWIMHHRRRVSPFFGSTDGFADEFPLLSEVPYDNTAFANCIRAEHAEVVASIWQLLSNSDFDQLSTLLYDERTKWIWEPGYCGANSTGHGP